MMSSVDAVVIGGGLLGAVSSYELARAGYDTLLLERGALNRESSGATAGNIHIQAIHQRRPGQKLDADNSVFLPFQRAASDLWDVLEAELEADLEMRRNGGFMVAETDAQVEELRHKHRMERLQGIPSELLTGDEARAEVPLLSNTVLAATYCLDDGYANPLLVTPAYLRAATRMGAQVEAFSPVTAIESHEGHYVVHSRAGRWNTQVVVNAAGAWISDVAAMAGIVLAMAPIAIQMHATVRTRPLLTQLIQHIGEGLSVKQVAAGNILIGGGWPAHQLDLSGRSAVSFESLVGNLAQARRVLPFLGDLRILRTWAGPLAAAADELPVVGEVPGRPGFFVVGGTYGFTLAPLWGRVIARLVQGLAPPVDIASVSAGRLVSGELRPRRSSDAGSGR